MRQLAEINKWITDVYKCCFILIGVEYMNVCCSFMRMYYIWHCSAVHFVANHLKLVKLLQHKQKKMHTVTHNRLRRSCGKIYFKLFPDHLSFDRSKFFKWFILGSNKIYKSYSIRNCSDTSIDDKCSSND